MSCQFSSTMATEQIRRSAYEALKSEGRRLGISSPLSLSLGRPYPASPALHPMATHSVV